MIKKCTATIPVTNKKAPLINKNKRARCKKLYISLQKFAKNFAIKRLRYLDSVIICYNKRCTPWHHLFHALGLIEGVFVSPLTPRSDRNRNNPSHFPSRQQLFGGLWQAQNKSLPVYCLCNLPGHCSLQTTT